jgi:hypothetical protein
MKGRMPRAMKADLNAKGTESPKGLLGPPGQ